MTGPKTALVTGAPRRIGRAICEALAADGWHLALHFRKSRAAAEELAAELNKRAGRKIAACFAADFASETETAGLVPRVAKEFGALHALINNASTFEPDVFSTATRQSWDRHIEANLRAPLVLAQSFAQQVPEGIDANIVNILDQRVLAPTPTYFSYTLSKCALWSLTQMMALALAPRIRVNGIGPGPTLPNTQQTKDDFAAEIGQTLLKRPIAPEEIADGVRFILSARSMTGQLITLDGGQHLLRSGDVP